MEDLTTSPPSVSPPGPFPFYPGGLWLPYLSGLYWRLPTRFSGFRTPPILGSCGDFPDQSFPLCDHRGVLFHLNPSSMTFWLPWGRPLDHLLPLCFLGPGGPPRESSVPTPSPSPLFSIRRQSLLGIHLLTSYPAHFLCDFLPFFLSTSPKALFWQRRFQINCGFAFFWRSPHFPSPSSRARRTIGPFLGSVDPGKSF